MDSSGSLVCTFPAVAVPVEHGRDGESVPEVVQPRGAPPGRGLDARRRDERGERVLDIAPVQRPAAAVHQERARLRLGECPVPGLLVAARRGDRGRVQKDLPGFAELGVEDDEHPRFQADVAPEQAAGLALAHAGHGQQADQRPPGRRPPAD